MTTTTTDTCLVHQMEAQSNHSAVAKSEMCLARSDLQCLDYHVCNKIMVNVPLWMKMFAQMLMTRILFGMLKYMVAGLSGCRDLLLSKKPCAVIEGKVNAGWKLDRSELTTMTWLRLESLVQEYWCSQAYTDENKARLLHLRWWDAISLGASFYYMLAPPLMPQHCVDSLRLWQH